MTACEQDNDSIKNVEAKTALLKLHMIICNYLFPSIGGVFAMGRSAQKVLELTLADGRIPNWKPHYYFHPAFFARKEMIQNHMKRNEFHPLTVKQMWKMTGRKTLSTRALPAFKVISWNYLHGCSIGICEEVRQSVLEEDDELDWKTLDETVRGMSKWRQKSLLRSLE
jgi:hypothetical protein